MYYIHDLYTDTWTAFETQEAVADWWGSKQSADLDLNVTGNDCYSEPVYTGCQIDDDGFTYIIFYDYIARLRRYQVFDNDFRSVDIRQWPDSIWDARYKPNHDVCGRYHVGPKQSHPSVTGPAMAHSTSRQNTDCVDYDELNEAGLPVPEKDRSEIRRKVLISDGDYENYVSRSWSGCRSEYHPKSWKDQYKSRKQWGKHRHIPRVCQDLPENGEDLADRLMAELVPAAAQEYDL